MAKILENLWLMMMTMMMMTMMMMQLGVILICIKKALPVTDHEGP
jgi:hypothetical protein